LRHSPIASARCEHDVSTSLASTTAVGGGYGQFVASATRFVGPTMRSEPQTRASRRVWSVVLLTSRRCGTSDYRKSDVLFDGRGDRAVISRIKSPIWSPVNHEVWTSSSVSCELHISWSRIVRATSPNVWRERENWKSFDENIC
jgi:hypothetical protein